MKLELPKAIRRSLALLLGWCNLGPFVRRANIAEHAGCEPSQQQPDQSAPDSGGPGGDNGAIAIPKKAEKPDVPPPPPEPKVKNPAGPARTSRCAWMFPR